ncbi:MAG: DUF3644 domain-containing protein [Gordonia sp. (in: high G+C Gram-positive bacteria)]|uniref:DUF3644 domain-containing protein n=1 Tax=Gordonia sp. (in: high G+C Gram-positive bacteria) TaxID=84139 RepID=UPI0039E556F7
MEAARSEAILAVRLFNDPIEPRSFEAFVVHMHVAWLYLLHARFARDNVEIRYRQRDNPRRFVKVDGEHKRWELAKCVEERWTDPDDPVRRNLEFFIALRNKIEHRHDHADRQLAEAVGGKAQALLLNFEQELTSSFGDQHSLATVLRFPVFIGSFTPEGEQALITLRDHLPASLKKFIAEYDSGVPDSVNADNRFELRLNVVMQTSKASDALAIQFMRWDDMSDEEKAAAELLGKRGKTIVREQKRRVIGHGLMKPGEAQEKVAAAVPFVFNSYHFLQSWRIKKIRPPKADPHPERTDEKYCVYDALNRSYGYTQAWVDWLIKNCSTEDGFRTTTGRDPKPKP